MRKFITSFLLIISFSGLLIGEENATDANLTDANSSDKKTELIEELKEVGAVDENDKIVQAVVNKVESDETNATQSANSHALEQLVKQIWDINEEIYLLKQKGDANASSMELNVLDGQKYEILAKIPDAIMHQVINEELLVEYLKHKKTINDEMEGLDKQSEEYFSRALHLCEMELTEISYLSLIKLEKYFTENAALSQFEEEFRNTLSEIRTNNFAKFQEITSSMSDEMKAKFDVQIHAYTLHKESYEEIFEYLMSHSQVFASNALYTSLNLKGFINWLNTKFPIEGINVGKIIIITLIMVFVFSLRKFLANIIYFFTSLFIRNKEKKEKVKEEFIDIIKLPLGFLLLLIGFDLSSSVYFSPSPVPVHLSDIRSIAYVILYAWLIVEIISGCGLIIIGNLAKKGGRKEILNLILRIVHILVIVIAILVVLTRLGFNVSAILASLGIGGLAVALATKDIIANFFASVMVVFDSSFSQGDMVEVDGIKGTIVETGMRKTTIRTYDNSLVSVSNSKLLDSTVVNWSRRRQGRKIELTVGVEYSTTVAQLQTCVKEIEDMLYANKNIAKSREQVLAYEARQQKEGAASKKTAKNSELDLERRQIARKMRLKQSVVSVDDLAGYKSYLFVNVSDFSASSIDIWIYCFSKSVAWGEYLAVKQEVMIEIMKILERNGVNFAFPSQSLYVEKMPRGMKDLEEEI